MSNTEKWREEFEAWSCNFYSGLATARDTWSAERQGYNDFSHHMAYHAYLAAKRADAQRIERLEKALNHIASWDEGPVVGPHFDEPASAEVARAALENKQ